MTGSRHKLGAADYLILIGGVQLAEISAPAPYADDEVLIRLGILLCGEEDIAVYGVYLQLMTAEVDERLDEGGDLSHSILVSEGVVVNLHSQRAAVYDFREIVLCEGLYAG